MLRALFRSSELRTKRNALARDSSEPDFTLNTSLSTLQALLGGDKRQIDDDMGAMNSTETGVVFDGGTTRTPFTDKSNQVVGHSDGKPQTKRQSSRPKIMLPRRSSRAERVVEPLPRVPVSVSIDMKTGSGIGLRCNSRDQSSLGIKVELVDPSGPCARNIFPGDRIVKIGDLYIDRMPLQVGMWALDKYLQSDPPIATLMLSREAPMLKRTKPKTRHLVKRSLQRRDIVHQVALKVPLLETIEEQPESGTKTNPTQAHAQATATRVPITNTNTNTNSNTNININTGMGRPINGNVTSERSMSGHSMATVHRLNKVLKATMEHDRRALVQPDVDVPVRRAPVYPDAVNISLLRKSVTIDDLSLIHQPAKGYSATPEPNPNQPTLFSIYFAKNTHSLGVRIIGAKKRTGEDRGIFVGKPHADYPEIRKPNFLELGDQIVKVNDQSLLGIPNVVAAKHIKEQLLGPTSVKISLLRYPRCAVDTERENIAPPPQRHQRQQQQQHQQQQRQQHQLQQKQHQHYHHHQKQYQQQHQKQKQQQQQHQQQQPLQQQQQQLQHHHHQEQYQQQKEQHQQQQPQQQQQQQQQQHQQHRHSHQHQHQHQQRQHQRHSDMSQHDKSVTDLLSQSNLLGLAPKVSLTRAKVPPTYTTPLKHR